MLKQGRPVGVAQVSRRLTVPVEHHEVASHTPDNSARSPTTLKSPPLPDRPQHLPHGSPAPVSPRPISFGDKNPFRVTPATPSVTTNPFYQPRIQEPIETEEDEDEELQKALAMSVDPTTDSGVNPPDYDDGRANRERSVRATAPPPSPTEKRGELLGVDDEGSRAGSPFGPRERDALCQLR
jgi:hypothetical protein